MFLYYFFMFLGHFIYWRVFSRDMTGNAISNQYIFISICYTADTADTTEPHYSWHKGPSAIISSHAVNWIKNSIFILCSHHFKGVSGHRLGTSLLQVVRPGELALVWVVWCSNKYFHISQWIQTKLMTHGLTTNIIKWMINREHTAHLEVELGAGSSPGTNQ